MTQVTPAVIITEDGTRYKLNGWRNGSQRQTWPERPAAIYQLTDEQGWTRLDQWNGSVGGDGVKKPKPDANVAAT